MKISEKNKEAVKSSLMVGVAYALICVFIVLLADKEYWLSTGLVAFMVGLCTGLCTTWYHEED